MSGMDTSSNLLLILILAWVLGGVVWIADACDKDPRVKIWVLAILICIGWVGVIYLFTLILPFATMSTAWLYIFLAIMVSGGYPIGMYLYCVKHRLKMHDAVSKAYNLRGAQSFALHHCQINYLYKHKDDENRLELYQQLIAQQNGQEE